MTARLKPCPFCGGEASLNAKMNWGDRQVSCDDLCTRHHITDAAAIAAWNRRTNAPELLAEIAAKDAEIARMKDALKPFADRADRYDPPEHDDEDVDWDTSTPRLRVKHLRSAREVLKGDTHE